MEVLILLALALIPSGPTLLPRARKLIFANAAKLILWVDVRGEKVDFRAPQRGPTPLFFCKSIIREGLFLSFCKSIILNALMHGGLRKRYYPYVLIIIELHRLTMFGRRMESLARCASL